MIKLSYFFVQKTKPLSYCFCKSIGKFYAFSQNKCKGTKFFERIQSSQILVKISQKSDFPKFNLIPSNFRYLLHKWWESLHGWHLIKIPAMRKVKGHQKCSLPSSTSWTSSISSSTFSSRLSALNLLLLGAEKDNTKIELQGCVYVTSLQESNLTKKMIPTSDNYKNHCENHLGKDCAC